MYSLKRISVTSVCILALAFATAALASAQVRPPLPRPSMKAGVMQTIGTTDISIVYSRPSVKGRPVFADPPASMAARAKGEATLDNGNERKPGEPLVPYGHLWRAGANEATLFTTADDVLINGQLLPAGKYSLHMIPTKDDWTIVFNKDDGQWGSFTYDAAKDALRVKTKAEPSDMQEALSYTIEPVGENSARVNMRWERLRVPFTVEVKDVVGSTINRLRTYVAGAKADDPAPWVNAANYAKANKMSEDAAKWFEGAIRASDEQVKAKPNFANYSRRANILALAGRMQDAIAAGEKALELGKAENADTKALEKRLADMKAGKN
jgi:tetratricopeptide (TPR) repeat protein